MCSHSSMSLHWAHQSAQCSRRGLRRAAERGRILPQPAGHTSLDAAQDSSGFLGCECTLLAHVKFFINHHPQVFLCRAALSHFSTYSSSMRSWCCRIRFLFYCFTDSHCIPPRRSANLKVVFLSWTRNSMEYTSGQYQQQSEQTEVLKLDPLIICKPYRLQISFLLRSLTLTCVAHN